MLATFAFAVLAATAHPAPPRNHLDQLFAQLAKAASADDAKPIENEIRAAFLQSGSASVDLLMSRAGALVQVGDTDKAFQILATVTAVAPRYAEGWHEKGKLEAEAGHDEAAMISLKKAVELNPREFAAWAELGSLLADYGAKPAALADLKKALALDPQYEGLDKQVDELSRDVEGNKI